MVAAVDVHDPARVPEEPDHEHADRHSDPVHEPPAERHATLRAAAASLVRPCPRCRLLARRCVVARGLHIVRRLVAWAPRSSRVTGGGIVTRIVRPEPFETPVYPQVLLRNPTDVCLDERVESCCVADPIATREILERAGVCACDSRERPADARESMAAPWRRSFWRGAMLRCWWRQGCRRTAPSPHPSF